MQKEHTGAGWGAGPARAAAVPCPLTACLPHPPPLAASSPRYSHTVAHTVAHMPTMDAKRQLPERNYKQFRSGDDTFGSREKLLLAMLPILSLQEVQSHSPRWCILDDAPPASEFVDQLREAFEKGEPWSFLSYDRDIGHGALPGFNDVHSKCPSGFPLMQASDIACLIGHNNRIARVGPLRDGARLWYRMAAQEPDCGAADGWPQVCACDLSIPDECDLEQMLNKTENIRRFGGSHSMTLVMSGEDNPHLSANPLVDKIRDSGFFHTVFYEALDQSYTNRTATKDRTRFEAYPKTMDMHYMLGREADFLSAATSAKLDGKRGVLAAWSMRQSSSSAAAGASKRALQMSGLDEAVAMYETEDSVSLAKFLELDGVDSFVNRTQIPPETYYSELVNYRFLLAPKGNGIQSPKFLEAVLMMTIPITLRHGAFEALQAYGMPIVLVDAWDEVTPEKLDEWWEELSPRLEAARWIATNRGMDELLNGACWRKELEDLRQRPTDTNGSFPVQREDVEPFATNGPTNGTTNGTDDTDEDTDISLDPNGGAFPGCSPNNASYPCPEGAGDGEQVNSTTSAPAPVDETALDRLIHQTINTNGSSNASMQRVQATDEVKKVPQTWGDLLALATDIFTGKAITFGKVNLTKLRDGAGAPNGKTSRSYEWS